MSDRLIPPPRSSLLSFRRRSRATASVEPPLGTLVADIFQGTYPRRVPSVVVLPRVIQVGVIPDRQVPAEDDASKLRFQTPSVSPPPPLVFPSAIVDNFTRVLAAAEEVERALEVRVIERRIATRVALRLSARTSLSAAQLHARERAGAARRTREFTAKPPHARAARTDPQRTDRARPRGAKSRPHQRRRWATAELIRVGVGTSVIGALIAVGGALGEIPRSTGPAVQTAGRGAQALKAGARSLMVADAAAGYEAFSAASENFRSALDQLDRSTTALQSVALRLDPTRSLQSGERLIRIGELAARVGQEAAEIVARHSSRSGQLTETLAEARPAFGALETRLQKLAGELAGIRPALLPAEVRSAVADLRAVVPLLQEVVQGFVASLDVVLELLGAGQDRQYLVVFQNNRELRPTGGFIGSLALVDVSRGAVRKIKVDSIYNPDGQLRDFLKPPRPLQKIAPRWFTRDANWFADFRVSAAKIAHLFERSGGPTVDGVLAVTPAILEDLLRLTGPIAMPSYGVTVSAENVTAETQRLVTYEYDRERNEPKAFIADLIPPLLDRVTTLPRDRWGELLSVLLSALEQKRALVFLRDEAAEALVVGLGWGGALPDPPTPSASVFADHLGRVEANIGGHKTDELVEQESRHEVVIGDDGAAVSTLVVTRRHRGSTAGTPGSDPAEDPLRKPSIVYERTFVPLGSELLDARGFTLEEVVPTSHAVTDPPTDLLVDPDLDRLERAEEPRAETITQGVEGGYTTFGGWVLTAPGETTVTVLRYRLPFQLPRPSLLASLIRFELRLTHQPGHRPVLHQTTIRLPPAFKIAWAGPPAVVTDAGTGVLAFGAVLQSDALWGAVIEEK